MTAEAWAMRTLASWLSRVGSPETHAKRGDMSRGRSPSAMTTRSISDSPTSFCTADSSCWAPGW